MGTAIGILAHVDAGKTTLSEQILFQTGVLRSAGRVDRKNAYLDCNPVERERGITVFSDQADFSVGGRKFTLIDTPGHADFSGEMERSLWVMDCAVLVVSCVEGIQSHTETVWRLLRRNRIPTLLFLNKTDRDGADPAGVLKEMNHRLGAECPDFTFGFSEGNLSTELAERLAGLDDGLLERYCSKGYDREVWLKTTKQLVADCRIFPAFCGSALAGQGVQELLQALAVLSPLPAGREEESFSARVYKVRHDRQGGRVVFLKVTSGILHAKDEIICGGGEEGVQKEKVDELRSYSASKFSPLEEAAPGDLCAATGLSLPMPGDVVGENAGGMSPFLLRPLLAAKVLFDEAAIPAKTMLGCFRQLEDEEPLLGVEWNGELQEIRVHVMGKIQLEVLAEIVRERFGMAVSLGPCQILYRETIASPTVGCGHFEPLRHYAEVHLRLSPGPRGSGVTFDSEYPTDRLASNWQNLIRTHVLEKEHRGVLTGSPLTDVRVTLLAGLAHIKHTEGGDFREATYRAVRQGLMHAQNVLLEPYYSFEVETEANFMGRVYSDLQKRNAVCESPESEGKTVRVCGRGPAALLMDYPQELTAFTRGRGRISLAFDGYEPCFHTQQIVEERGYDPERDTENSADSVFCSHGAGYPVKWFDAPGKMHLQL